MIEIGIEFTLRSLRLIDKGVTMKDALFRVPVTVELPNGEVLTLCSASETAVLMMEKWPQAHGPRYLDALQACTHSMTTADDVEKARRAFLAAAKEAGLNVQGIHDDDPHRVRWSSPNRHTSPMRNGGTVDTGRSKKTFSSVSWRAKPASPRRRLRH
ncbi:DUF982 domain-containing protein (plasmid) [Mesorhizobium sp. INR15]|nr:DUF982 domain-containing protein [Mesorhizobium sp. INR15]QPC96047.1 DUF982 domain-containing protein [Mesorhizobium sp. INR15]